MGMYLNPGIEGFESALNSEIYVDKTGLIAQTNKLIGTEQKWLCISRPRRFGKSMAEYVGFTENEVHELCIQYNMDFAETKRWYDGYSFKKAAHVYSPRSVVEAMRNEDFDSYWTTTETYESLKGYIQSNFDGLKDAVIQMLGGGRCEINSRSFQNDMTSFKNKDDILTLLVHLGYLAYDEVTKEVYIPNLEVRSECHIHTEL